MNRGHERFDSYCSECHGRLGDGNGMIPSRGFRRPPSYHIDVLRNAKTGHFFDVMTNGFGAMPPYRTQVPVRDRWAIAAYIRALQLSQNGDGQRRSAGRSGEAERAASHRTGGRADGAEPRRCAVTTAETQPTRPPQSTGIVAAQIPALVIGILGAIACIIGWVAQPEQFYRAYLPSYIFWFEIVVGSLGILMLQYVTGGEWGVLIRRPLGAAARTIVVMAVLFIPIIIGAKHIYLWANPAIVAHDEVLQHKQRWLSYGFWSDGRSSTSRSGSCGPGASACCRSSSTRTGRRRRSFAAAPGPERDCR